MERQGKEEGRKEGKGREAQAYGLRKFRKGSRFQVISGISD